MTPVDAPPGWWRFRRWPGRLFDIGVVLALLAVGAVIVLTTTNEIPRLSTGHLPVYLAFLLPLASLLARRRHPAVPITAVAGGVVVVGFFHAPTVLEPLVMVGVYIAASRFTWRTSLAVAIALYLLLLVSAGIHGRFGPALPISLFVPLAGAYAVGVYVGMRVAYIEALQARARQLARERDLLAQQAVAEERVRIARELHDIVAHNLSLITVQAGAMRTQLEDGSAAARSADVIASTGHTAMDEMRRMLGVLRLGMSGDATPGRDPQPDLSDVERLVTQTSAAGVATTLRVSGERRPLPPALELNAYRIVQEALTNVLRHAGPATCTVDIAYTPSRLRIEVTDDGRGSGDARGGGHGIVGMRERAALFGGDLQAGPLPQGGYAVRASLPTDPRPGNPS